MASNDVLISDMLTINQIHLDKYHITLGPVWKFKRYKIVTGLQYIIGQNKDSYQIVNYSDPLEYNTSTDQSLVGIGSTNA